MRRKEISGASGGQRDFKGLVEILHEMASPFQNRKSCMPLIQVADFRLNANSPKQAPSTNAKQQFLLEAQFWATPIKLAGNSAMSGIVRGIIAV